MNYTRLMMQNDLLRNPNMELFKTVIGIQDEVKLNHAQVTGMLQNIIKAIASISQPSTNADNGPLLGAIKHKKAKTDVSENMINKNMIDIDVDDDVQPVRSPILVFEKRICEEKAKLKKSRAPDTKNQSCTSQIKPTLGGPFSLTLAQFHSTRFSLA
ncbi:hypothetical protein H0H87_007612 [Tephrocybe sp. NHM501043]|nr:hypothetical protein H0H87_007612 [Tephrocybe sp. NHM501043]